MKIFNFDKLALLNTELQGLIDVYSIYTRKYQQLRYRNSYFWVFLCVIFYFIIEHSVLV